MTVNVRTDSCNRCDDGRGDIRENHRGLRPPSRRLTIVVSTLFIVYRVEIRRFAASNGRGDSLGDVGDLCRRSREY